jgi:hypothetical protein
MMPTMMDSHEKPGIAGSTNGVETEIVVELLVVVGVLMTVIVDTEVLTTVVVRELVVVTDSVAAEVDVLTCELTCEEMNVEPVVTELEAVEVAVLPLPLATGGSR